ncbi:MAG: hypothetical protein FE78DRAFT_36757 [Acidomyces sp. 'richmondensis']|nr:MAG: hypothetical protein FE78DRAFT_36757 [Acidomyces sp. 'richmondensis']
MAEMVEKDAATRQIEILKIEETSAPKYAGDDELVDKSGNIRRIPIASTDPNDPLNFSKWRKLGVLICCCWFSIFSLVLVGGLGPSLPVFIELYAPQGHSVESIFNLTTYPSSVMAGAIGAAKCNSYGTKMVCRILQGFATGAIESVLPLIISDMTFLDERGFFFSIYWGSQNTINAVFLISISYLVAATSWRWFYWLLTILGGFGTIMGVLLLAETRYQRSPMSLNGQIVHTDEFGVTSVLSDAEAVQRFGTQNETNENSPPSAQKIYLQHLKLFQGTALNPGRVEAGAFYKMILSCSSPAVVWAILSSSISPGIEIAMSLTYGTVLEKLFHWSPASVGLINVGMLRASVISTLWAGLIGEKINLWLARRRKGTHIPKDSLIILIIPSIISAIGIVVFAAAAMLPQKHSSWGLSWAGHYLNLVLLAYPQQPGPALVGVIGMKYIISFGASYGITLMVSKFNYLQAFMILFAIFTLIFVLGIPVYILNPKWRAYIGKKHKN